MYDDHHELDFRDVFYDDDPPRTVPWREDESIQDKDTHDDSDFCLCDDCRDERASEWYEKFEEERLEAEFDAKLEFGDLDPEAFGFEDLGSYVRFNIRDIDRRYMKRLRSGSPKSTGARRKVQDDMEVSWSRQTRNRHQWEARAKREAKRFVPPLEDPPKETRPSRRLTYAYGLSDEYVRQLNRRDARTQKRIQLAARRERVRQCFLEREYQRIIECEARFLSWGDLPVMEGMSVAEAEAYEREWQDDF